MGALAVFIMAGGRSSRFGSDKALHRFGDRPLIAHVAAAAFHVTDDVAVVTGDPGAYAFLGLPCHTDVIPGLGPLGGILTALERTTAERVLVLACDMPNLDPGLLRYLAGLSPDFDVVIPVVNGWIEPLHAVYAHSCLPAVRRAVDEGRRQVRSIFPDLRVREVGEEEIRVFGDPAWLFRNINFLHDAVAVTGEDGSLPPSPEPAHKSPTRSEPMQNHRIMLDLRADEALAGDVFTAELLAFYRELFDYQAEQHARFAAWDRRSAVLAGPPAQGHILTLAGDDRAVVAAGAAPLAAMVQRHHPGVPFPALAERLARDPSFYDECVGAVMGRDFESLERLSQAMKMGFDEMIFMVVNWLKPLVIALREELDPAAGEGDVVKDCPFCGWPPDLALIVAEREGKRYLHCTFCEHRWPFARLACAVCGNDDPSSLGYLGGEGSDRLRVDYCGRCGGYIKTVRLGKLEDDEDFDPVVENLLTATLDSLALREGYRRP